MTVFAFDGGSPSLDLLATLHRRDDARIELLADADALRTWSTEAELPISRTANVTDADLASVVELREAVHQLVTCDPSSSNRSTNKARTLVNDAARLDGHCRQIADDGTVTTEPGNVAALVSSIARDAISLLRSYQGTIKQCADEHCTTMFVDESRGSRRRWCSMQRCGTRSKVNAHRQRTRHDHV